MRQSVMSAAAVLVLSASAQAAPVTKFCDTRVCGSQPGYNGNPTRKLTPNPGSRTSYAKSDVRLIPNPRGCPRTRLSCACRLAAYWGLGSGLDATVTWLHRFARVSTPGPRVAAYRPGHIFGIEGAEGDGYRVVDFNSGGHRNRTYVMSARQLSRFTLLDTHQRVAHAR